MKKLITPDEFAKLVRKELTVRKPVNTAVSKWNFKKSGREIYEVESWDGIKQYWEHPKNANNSAKK